uniref:hypothetical protein n=1 Tax=Euzebya sp. TaxID=1971409 RepID=UPI003511293A
MPSTSPPPSTADGPPRRRLQRWLLVAAVALGVLVLAQAPLPAYVQRPGPAIALADAIELPDPDPVDGDFLFLTIRLDDATTWSALAAGFDGDAHVVSRDAILGGASEADFVAEQTALFESAERTAVAVGLAAAGSDVDPDAVDIRAEGVGGPAAGLRGALAVAGLATTADRAGGRVV